MCVTTSQIVAILTPKDWATFLQGVGAVWVAVVATIALTTWRSQMRAEKQLHFIDSITDCIHAYITAMEPAITQLSFAKIGIESYEGIAQKYSQFGNAEAIAYIEDKGPERAKAIYERLESVRPLLANLQSLATKGQVLGFNHYDSCFEACMMLVWSFKEVDAFCGITGLRGLNWNNEVIQASLAKLADIDPDAIRENLQQQNVAVVAFAAAAYKKALR